MIREFLPYRGIAIALLILLSGSVGYSQQFKRNLPLSNFAFIEKNLLPDGEGSLVYVTFRIPFQNLVFVKSGNRFEGGAKFEIEVRQQNKIIHRGSVYRNLFIGSYEQSNSQTDYLEGLVSFTYNEGDLIIYPSISISNTDDLIRLDSITVLAKEQKKGNIVAPLVVQPSIDTCSANLIYNLANFRNSITYSKKSYQLLIPVLEKTDSISIRIEQESKTILQKNVGLLGVGDLKLLQCGPGIGVEKINTSSSTSLFVVYNFSYLLKEGTCRVLISYNGGKEVEFNLPVVWVDKPKSLFNPEFAIQLLEIIADKQKVKELLDKPREDQYRELVKYWDGLKQNNKVAFNDLMFEFYRRADYAIENYRNIGKQNGALSDRGRIYIKFGVPDEVTRDYTDDNRAVEIWYYKNVGKEFVFVDNTGLGNFTLSN